MSREDHLAWCKERAGEYLDRGDIANALASFRSDIGKHLETGNHGALLLLDMEGTRCVMTNDASGLRRLIDGFN